MALDARRRGVREACSAAPSTDVKGFAFERAVERLTDLALLDVQRQDLNSTPRYTLHPLYVRLTGMVYSHR